MAILDFLKKKEAQKPKKSVKKPTSAKATAGKPAKKSEKISVETPVKVVSLKVKNDKFSYEAIRQPHISEKASYLGQIDQYIFEVSPNYNKHEIKKSVEGIYGVHVLSVNIIKIPAKKRRMGKTEGFRKAYKKAVVKIKEGQKIEIL
jgi:large subunit ribosomal protein L23